LAETTEQSMVPLASDKMVVTNGLRSAIAIGKDRLMSHGLRSAIGKPRGDVATPALDPDQIVRSKGLASAIGGKPRR
jgi:hypothetical protein